MDFEKHKGQASRPTGRQAGRQAGRKPSIQAIENQRCKGAPLHAYKYKDLEPKWL